MITHCVGIAVMSSVDIVHGDSRLALSKRFEHGHHRGQPHAARQEDHRAFDMRCQEEFACRRGNFEHRARLGFIMKPA